MKKYILTTILAAALITPTWAQSAPKILVVDVAGVLNNFNEANSEKLKFQAQVDKVNEQISKSLVDLQNLQKQVQESYAGANNPSLSPEGRSVFQKQFDAKRQELTDLDAKVTAFRNESADILQKQQNSVVTTEVNKIKEAVKQIAIAHNANLVLNNSGIGAVVYSEATLDVTNEVIKMLNDQSPPAANTGTTAGATTPAAAPRSNTPQLTLPPIGGQ